MNAIFELADADIEGFAEVADAEGTYRALSRLFAFRDDPVGFHLAQAFAARAGGMRSCAVDCARRVQRWIEDISKGTCCLQGFADWHIAQLLIDEVQGSQ